MIVFDTALSTCNDLLHVAKVGVERYDDTPDERDRHHSEHAFEESQRLGEPWTELPVLLACHGPQLGEHAIRVVDQVHEREEAGALNTAQPDARAQGVPTEVAPPRRRDVPLWFHLAGYSQVEIARDLGYSQPVVVRQILKRPEIAALIERVRAAQLERIQNGEFGPIAMAKAAAPKAMQKHIDLIDAAASEKVQLQAADAVLDRAGYAKTQQVQVHHVHQILAGFTPDELDRYGRTGEYPQRYAEVFRQLEGPKGL